MEIDAATLDFLRQVLESGLASVLALVLFIFSLAALVQMLNQLRQTSVTRKTIDNNTDLIQELAQQRGVLSDLIAEVHEQNRINGLWIQQNSETQALLKQTHENVTRLPDTLAAADSPLRTIDDERTRQAVESVTAVINSRFSQLEQTLRELGEKYGAKNVALERDIAQVLAILRQLERIVLPKELPDA